MDDGAGSSWREVVPESLTIEVFHGEVPASEWRRAHENDLVEAAVTDGASFWDWHSTRWGVVLELLFDSDERLEGYRRLPGPEPHEHLRLGADPDRPAAEPLTLCG
jgi:hypothetical protein